MIMKKIISSTIYFIYAIFITSLGIGNVYSVEWNCAATTNTGSFTRSTNCAISGDKNVVVASLFEINGTNTDMNNLVTITAATNKRHFLVANAENSPYAVLILRYLKLVGGEPQGGGHNGGSIYAGRSTCEVNLYSCIITNNRGSEGGGIFIWGGGKNVVVNIYNSIISNNEAVSEGGAIRTRDAVVTIRNTKIHNNQATNGNAGAIYVHSTDLTLERTNISNNTAHLRGGALSMHYGPVVIMRQSSFISNYAKIGQLSGSTTYYGDDIYIHTPATISSINTYFDNPNNPRGITGGNFKNCGDNLCTQEPFTGSCTAVSDTNAKLGVICNLNCSANLFAPLVSVAKSAPLNTCKPWQKCDAGYRRINGNATSDAICIQCGQGQFQSTNQFSGTACQVWQDAKCSAGHKRVNGNATSDATCVQCDQGQFQPANQFTGTNCTDWKQCNNNEYISFNGNRTTNRICVLKPTTTTAAPVSLGNTTSAAPLSTTTTSAASVSIANTTTIAATSKVTTTKSSATSRSSRTPKENGEEEKLSSSITNTLSTISIIIVFIMAICNL